MHAYIKTHKVVGGNRMCRFFFRELLVFWAKICFVIAMFLFANQIKVFGVVFSVLERILMLLDNDIDVLDTTQGIFFNCNPFVLVIMYLYLCM